MNKVSKAIHKKLLIEAFILAGIAFYGGGSWKAVFKVYMKKDKLLYYKLSGWMQRNDEKFNDALDCFFSEVER